MKNILAMEQLDLLRVFTNANVLLAFSYDGVLAALPGPLAEAELKHSTRALLARVSVLYPVVVITSRGRADVLTRVEGLGVKGVAGNHGLEISDMTDLSAQRRVEQVAYWRPVLEACIAALPGLVLDDKTYSMTVHYGALQDTAHARTVIMQAAARLDDAKVLLGKGVIHLVPEGAEDKGTALLREQARWSCDRAIYVGDDITDEDVFELAASQRLLGIRVDSDYGSAASHFIPDQTHIDELLTLLIDLRQP